MATFIKTPFNSITGTILDDLIIVNDAADAEVGTIDGDGGIDEIRFSPSTEQTLTLGSNVTNIESVVIGTGTDPIADTSGTLSANIDASLYGSALIITGNAGNNTLIGTAYNDDITGGEGNDILDGGAGADVLSGGAGDDTYIVDNVSDVVVEGSNPGLPIVTLASTDAAGVQGNGASSLGANYSVALSADGRYVVFESSATNLVEGDSNGVTDIYIKDLYTGAITRVSADALGIEGNGASTGASVSADGRYVVFNSAASNLVAADTNGVQDVFVKDLQTGEITRVNTDATGVQGNASGAAGAISADGRYAVFSTSANNLVAGDTNGLSDVFLKDLQTGGIILASADAGGTPAGGGSGANVSADGRYVVFLSTSSNLVAGVSSDYTQLFHKDLQTGVVTLVSADATGAEGNSSSSTASRTISADGRYVEFTSFATNLVPGDTNGVTDVFVKDTQTGAITRVNTDAAGAQANAATLGGAISPDGRYVVFSTAASNLVPGDTGIQDVFVKDLQTGAIALVSTDATGVQGDSASFRATFSGDGQYVVYQSTATNLVTGDTNGVQDVFVATNPLFAGGGGIDTVQSSVSYTLGEHVENLALTGTDNIDGTGNELDNVITGNSGSNILDGGTGADTLIGGLGDDTYLIDNAGDVVIEQFNEGTDTVQSSITYTLSDNVENLTLTGTDNIDGTGNELDNVILGNSGDNVLDGGAGSNILDGGAGNDTYIVDDVNDIVAEGSIVSPGSPSLPSVTLVSTDAAGVQGNSASNLVANNSAAVSANGRYVVFQSAASNLVDGDTNGVNDVFIKDLQTGEITRVSTDDSTGAQGNGASNGATVSADGRYVVFNSTATNLVAGDANGFQDIFIKDLQTGVTTLVSTDATGAQGNGLSNAAAVSPDGRYVVFSSAATNLVAGDTNGIQDVFLKDMQTGAITRVNTDATGAQEVGVVGSQVGTVSADGQYVVFRSFGANLVAGDTNNASDIFRKDLISGAITRVNTDAFGAQGNGTTSGGGIISADGRYAVFNSTASNLVAGDTNGTTDVFLKDLQTGEITLVSTDADGTQGNGASTGGAVSAGGRYVVFQSAATNLVAGDTNGTTDVFVKDLQTGAIARLSTDASGIQGNGLSSTAHISNDGRYVVFQSGANNLVAGDANAANDVIVVTNPLYGVGGIDTVESSVSYTLGANVENLTLTGIDNINGTGNELSNVITGNYGDNVFDGGAGIDTFIGGAGNDTYMVDNLGEEVIEQAGEGYDHVSSSVSFTLGANVEELTLTGFDNISGSGNDLDNFITGNSANNVLDGGAGNDALFGGEGVNTLIGGSGNDFLNGGTGADTLIGGSGDDYLFGYAGADTEIGGLGNDIYGVLDAGDVVTENANEGIDTVLSSVSYTLPDNVENLELINSDNINGTGNALDNGISGNFMDNVLDGGAGADFMAGDLGNDTYVVDNAGDVVFENADQGIDTVRSSVDYFLSDNVENLTLTGTAHNGTGNELDNVIIGNSGDNVLDGGAGADTLNGGAGNDTYIIDNSSDVVIESSNGLSAITRVSMDVYGVEGNGQSGGAHVSADGRYVVFQSSATNLVAGDTNGVSDVFVKDLYTGAITRASTDANGAQANSSNTGAFNISADGRYVAFGSTADNLVPGDTNGQQDIFVKDLQTGAMTLASRDALGNQVTSLPQFQPGATSATDISADGRYVVFTTTADNLVPGDTGMQDVFFKDLQTGAITLVSTDSSGVHGNNGSAGGSGRGTITDDARYVVFLSFASNLVPGDTNSVGDIFVKDLLTGAITRVSTDATGAQADGQSTAASISPDGRYVVFASAATNLVAGDTNGVQDTFIKDLHTGVITRVSTDVSGEQANATSGAPDISADGRYVVFQSTASNLVSGDTNGVSDVFVKDLQTGAIMRVSTDIAGNGGNLASAGATITADGQTIVFQGQASNLVAGDTNGVADVFVVKNPFIVGGGGLDTVQSSVSYTLGTNVENLTLTGTDNIDGTGNELDNVLTGNSGDNVLTGGAGDDVFQYATSNNGLDTITDFATGDVIRVAGAGFDGPVTAGDGSSVDANQVQVSEIGGVTTLHIGTDATPGADITLQLTGSFSANQFSASGTDISLQSGSSNQAPELTGVPAVLSDGTEDTAYLVSLADLTQGYTDADGDTLSVSGLSADYGTVTDNLDGTYTLTPTADYHGAVTLSYNVTDGQGGSTPATLGFNLGAVNDAPVLTGAQAVLAAGTEDTNYLVNVAQLTQGYTDVDGDTLSVSGLSADYGTVTDNLDGTYTLTPTANYNGAVTLSYNVTDGQGGSTPAALGFNIVSVNDAPALTGTQAVLADGAEDTPYTMTLADLTQGYTDVDGDTLSVTGLSADHGAVTDNLNGTYTLTPPSNYNGPVTLTYTVTDGQGASLPATLNFNLAPINDAPTLNTPLVDKQATQNTAFSYTVSAATFVDIDAGDTLTYSATQADGSALPTWLSFDPNTRQFSGTPGGGDVGVFDVKVVATDSGNATSEDIFTLTVQAAGVTLTGTANADVLSGGAGDDVISGLGGDDQLFGNGGTDRLDGGTGNDLLDGGAGTDTLIGGAGNDTYIVDETLDVVTESAGAGTDSVQSSASYTLSTNVENLTLTGTGNINGTGNTLANVITGNDGNNRLDGGTGTDTLTGGLGDDTYVVNVATDVVTEGANEGTDTVESGVTYTLGANLENLTLTGTANRNGTGNTFDNILTGNSGNNILNGGTGADALIGGAGNDTYVVDDAGDTVTEQAGEGTDLVQSSVSFTLSDNVENLTLTGTALNGTGNTLNNTITGNASNNLLDGGAGIDTLVGGAGNDTYIVDETLDVVTEAAGAGTDLVQSSAASFTLGSNVENLTLTGTGNINGTGNTLANVITGNSADNTLSGGTGVDTLIGGAGNDTYIVDNVGDVVTEQTGEGTDTVQSSVTYTLGANLENLTLTGTGNINGTGNTLNNTITGNSGNNILNGGTGADALIGGAGNDTYVVDDAGDTVTEQAGEGTDLVQSSVSFTLSDNVENLTLTGTALNGTGNTLNNTITGNASNNLLDGGAGIDTLVGGAGNDTYIVDETLDVVTEAAGAGTDLVQSSASYTLSTNVENLTLTGTGNINGTGNTLANVITGNDGNNRLDGGTGSDTLTGGLGDDTYVVNVATDVVTEGADAGTDTVESGVTYTLGTNLENLTLTGTANRNGTGNTLDNILTGNSGNNILNGGTGADALIGGAGNDTYVVDDAGDTVTEQAGEGTDLVQSSVSYTLSDNVENLTLTGTALNGTGNTLNNTITGNASANLLDGGAGTDTLIGGAGNDTYIVDETLDVVTEAAGAGTDLVQSSAASYTLGSNVENLTLTGTGNINGTGNTLANVITGNDGNNRLDGGTGSDTLAGGLGDDTYVVNVATDVVTEGAGAGTDTVESGVTYTLGANLENLTLTGTGSINGTGNTLANTITGNDGNNRLDGGTGSDVLTGGLGDDTYVVDVATDVVTEGASAGTDTVESGVTYTLGANLENLTLVGTGNINGTGNTLNNTITGNTGNNILDGGAGADSMAGGLGNDTYNVDQAGDVIVEAVGGGTDTVVTGGNYTLGANLENLILDGQFNESGTGNALDNVLTVRGFASFAYGNTLDGGAGADTMSGGNGDDTYYVDNAGDVVVESVNQGTDTVISTVSYTLAANVENLTLVGTGLVGTGNALNNTYTINNTGNSIVEAAGGGTDTVISSVNYTLDANVENLTLAGTGLVGTGNALDNTYTTGAGNTIVEAVGGGTDTVVTGGNYTLGANLENLILDGQFNESGTGNALDNVLTVRGFASFAYGNTLDGGAGADTMSGGNGDDTYYVDNAGDVVVESVNQGTDTVISTVSYTLAANVENLTLVGTGLVGTGNALNNTYTINNTGNSIVEAAGGGTDTVISSVNYTLDANVENLTLAGTGLVGTGNALDNTYTTGAGNTIVEAVGGGTDTVVTGGNYTLGANLENLILDGQFNESGTGNALDNVLTVRGFASFAYGNTLDGGAGADTMSGGNGDDTYYVDNAGDVVVESVNQGTDTVISTVSYTLAANVENLTLVGTGLVGTGNALNNTYTINNTGNSIVEAAGGGTDTVISSVNYTLDANVENLTLAGTGLVGTGNALDNTYTTGAGNTIVEAVGGGTDTVVTGGNYTLGANLENLILDGQFNESGTGNALDNVLTVRGFASFAYGNTLDGGAGADTMSGGNGDDTYYVDNAGDVVVESVNQGTDTVISTVSYTLAANVENLTLVGTGLVGTGNAANNTLNGGTGDNTLIGGLGNDTLTGGAGADQFVFDTLPNAATNVDTITDFAVGTDLIVLSASIFTDIAPANQPLSAGLLRVGAGLSQGGDLDDRLVFDTTVGGLYYDADGSGAGTSVKIATVQGTGLNGINESSFFISN